MRLELTRKQGILYLLIFVICFVLVRKWNFLIDIVIERKEDPCKLRNVEIVSMYEVKRVIHHEIKKGKPNETN